MKGSGNTVLVTGGSSGIGLALAKAFLATQNKVIICGRNEEKLKRAQAANEGLEIAVCDVTDQGQIDALKKRCDELGGINVLINNAGTYQEIDVQKNDVSLEMQLQDVDINISGTLRLSHTFLPDLLKLPDAALVTVTSGLAFIPLAYAPLYGASKAALRAWTQCVRYQLQNTSVRVFELLPPSTDTSLNADTGDMKQESPQNVAANFLKAFAKDKLEVTMGQSSQLRLMRRVAPNAIFNAMNKEQQKIAQGS